jgi:hypothetical protein
MLAEQCLDEIGRDTGRVREAVDEHRPCGQRAPGIGPEQICCAPQHIRREVEVACFQNEADCRGNPRERRRALLPRAVPIGFEVLSERLGDRGGEPGIEQVADRGDDRELTVLQRRSEVPQRRLAPGETADEHRQQPRSGPARPLAARDDPGRQAVQAPDLDARNRPAAPSHQACG